MTPAVCLSGDSGKASADVELAGTLKVAGSPPMATRGGGRVRRLTPLECERLQGFPDGWTDVAYRGREHPADGPRYRALGNSMAVPVVRWIGERIEVVERVAGDGRRYVGGADPFPLDEDYRKTTGRKVAELCEEADEEKEG